MITKNILIIGGYGTVGEIISKHLSVIFPNKVIVAGRNYEKAKRLSEELNLKIIPKQFDVLDDNADFILENVQLVIMCVDQKNTHFISKCIENKIDYIDITADYKFFNKVEKLHNQAVINNMSILLSIGLAPGISNLLAKNTMNKLQEIKKMELFVLLGLGEKHGEAAYRWTFNNFHTKYKIKSNFKQKVIKSFSYPMKTKLEGNRWFYSFDFSDQHILAKNVQLSDVITRFAFDLNFLTKFMAILRKLRVTRIFKNNQVQNLMLFIFKKLNLGSAIFAVKALGTRLDGKQYESVIIGNSQSQITALMTVISAIEVLKKSPERCGINHIQEMILDIPSFFEKLQKLDNSIKIKL